MEEGNIMKNLKRLVIMALMAALTAIATMVIQIPTPLSGYIHLGDSLVLLCGIILGPVSGAFTAGIGSMMADVLTGYFIYAPATFLIKGLAAFLASLVFKKMTMGKKLTDNPTISVIIPGFFGALAVVMGYFIYEIFLYGLAASAANMVFNMFQGLVGILVSVVLFPILSKIPDIRILMAYRNSSTY